jgi:hypothetical protein
MDCLNDEATRFVPVRSMKSLEAMLGFAEHISKRSRISVASKGGKALKPNALQGVIEGIARDRPDINCRQLEHELRSMARAGHPIILRVETTSAKIVEAPQMIHFHDRGERRTPLSGLKDRLSRAKRKIIAQTS